MKQVTIENVKKRILELEIAGCISLNEERELDCLRQLVAVTEQVQQMAAENAALKAAIPPLKNINDVTDSWDDVSLAEEVGFNNAVSTILKSLPETPATNAAIAALRAEGVEMLAKQCEGYATNHVYSFTREHCLEFAARLRQSVQVKGVQS